MAVQGPRGPYYRMLDFVARLMGGHGVSGQRRVAVLAALGTLLLGLTWTFANVMVSQAGELPGTPSYDRLLYSYLMRLVCVESLVTGAVLLSTLWAQQAGRIPSYTTIEEQE